MPRLFRDYPYSGGTALSGRKWWTGRWLEALDTLRGWERFTPYRWYGRRPPVLKLTVERGHAAGTVQGSGWQTHQVRVALAPLPDDAWEQALDALAGAAMWEVALLNGELPLLLEETLAAAGHGLFPTRRREVDAECDCLDVMQPCRHIAAVYYAAADHMNGDPFALLELRGRTRREILDGLHERRARLLGVEFAPAALDGAAEHDEPAAPDAVKDPTSVGTFAGTPDEFWRMGAELDQLALSFQPPPADALPVKQLGPPPFSYDRREFTRVMEQTYRAVSADVIRRMTEDAR